MKNQSCIRIFMFLSSLAACLSWSAPSTAQDYPKGPVQIVVPFTPGGATDIFWRTVVDAVSKNLNAQVALVNKPGGGGIVGLSSVAAAKPDGYTLCAPASDNLNITPLFSKDIPIDTIKDLTYLAKLAVFPQTIAVRADSPFKTIEDLVAFAKANPKKLKSCTPGVGTSPYMALHVFNHDAKVELVPVAFAGGGETVPAILGGHVDFGFIAMPAIKTQFVSGAIRILAILSKNRHPLYPSIPTVYEKGYKQTVVETGIALVGPKGLQPAVVKKWEEVTEKTMKDPQVVSALQRFDYVVDLKKGEDFKKEISEDLALFRKLLPASAEKK